MQRIAFTMKLFPGYEDEYKKRHDEIWDDMKSLLKNAGIKDFSIFLDEETNTLFAYLLIENASALDDLPKNPVQQKWWAWMKDIMESHADNSPVQKRLKEVFYLP
ncbi:MAG: L-rhamnose mutarotase [Bacteroidetes bacterium]|nr:L-rhamnose mutarotase [Bacteroidota bacterium]